MPRFLTAGAGAVALGLSVAATSMLAAQTCVGYAPFANAPVRVAGDFAIADHATTYGASVVGGDEQPGLFGGASLSGTRFDGTNSTGKNLGLSGGFSLPLVTLPGTEICPVIDYTHAWGPNSGGFDVSSNAVSIGGAIGHQFPATPTLMLVPFADVRWLHASTKVSSGGASSTGSDNLGVLTLGSGIMFSKTVTLRPALEIPFNDNNSSTVFLISIGFGFGK
ncbi:MAG TPA: hypothetical protein VGM82_05230 [Gemmatimonadaceae bacterium]|jgi:hypothetical protein